MTQRSGSRSLVNFYHEGATTYGLDTGITAGFRVPLQDEEGFGTDQNRIEAFIFDGSREGGSSVLDSIQASGPLPIGLEFIFVGHPLAVAMGGYTRIALPGSKSLHRFFPSDPLSCQLEKGWTEAPAIYIRNPGIRINAMNFRQQLSGAATYGLDTMGNGDEKADTTTPFQAVTNEGYRPTSYFNGALYKGGVALAKATTFELVLGNDLSRSDVLFSEIAGEIVAGIFASTGQLGLFFENLDYYNEARNNTYFTLECIWADKKPSAGPLNWMRVRMAKVLASRTMPRAGGRLGKSISQRFVSEYDTTDSGYAAEAIGTIPGPYLITAGVNDKLSVKVDGAAGVVKTLTAGPARTDAQIVTDLLAAGGIAGAVSDSFLLRPRIVSSNAIKSAGTIQIDITEPQSAHATLGFDGTTHAGVVTHKAIIELFNNKVTNYV